MAGTTRDLRLARLVEDDDVEKSEEGRKSSPSDASHNKTRDENYTDEKLRAKQAEKEKEKDKDKDKGKADPIYTKAYQAWVNLNYGKQIKSGTPIAVILGTQNIQLSFSAKTGNPAIAK